jgi:hypothetical protein
MSIRAVYEVRLVVEHPTNVDPERLETWVADGVKASVTIGDIRGLSAEVRLVASERVGEDR